MCKLCVEDQVKGTQLDFFSPTGRTSGTEQDNGRVPARQRHISELRPWKGSHVSPCCGSWTEIFYIDSEDDPLPSPWIQTGSGKNVHLDHNPDFDRHRGGVRCLKCGMEYWDTYELPEWIVLKGSDQCTEVKIMWCPNCNNGQGKYQRTPVSCHQLTCARCWSIWARIQARTATARLAYARRIRRTRGRPWVCIIRPPNNTIPRTKEALLELRQRAYKIAKEHGVKGGVAVLHWGVTHGGQAFRWAPHVHIVGYLEGRYKPGPSKEGWTVKFEKISGDGGLWKNVEGVLYYELGHAVRWEDGERHAITWFGSMGYNQFPDPDMAALAAMGFNPISGPICPECGGPLEDPNVWDRTTWPFERIGVLGDRG